MDPQALIAASAKRPLRPGEIAYLHAYIERQQALLNAANSTISNLMPGHESKLASPHLEVELHHTGGLAVTFPGQHTITIPTGVTQASMGFAMQALVKILQDRAPAAHPRKHTVGTGGAPIQHDLSKLFARSAKPAAKRLPPAAKREATLDDLADLEQALGL